MRYCGPSTLFNHLQYHYAHTYTHTHTRGKTDIASRDAHLQSHVLHNICQSLLPHNGPNQFALQRAEPSDRARAAPTRRRQTTTRAPANQTNCLEYSAPVHAGANREYIVLVCRWRVRVHLVQHQAPRITYNLCSARVYRATRLRMLGVSPLIY